MGIAIRTRASDLETDISPPLWKIITGEALTVEDIGQVDAALGAFLVRLRDWVPPPQQQQLLLPAVAAAGSGGGGGGGGGAGMGGWEEEGGEGSGGAARAGLPDPFTDEFGDLMFVAPLTPLTLAAARYSGGVGGGGGGGGERTLLPQLWGAPLAPLGGRTRVTAATRGAFIKAVIEYAMGPYSFAAAALRAGMAAVVPSRALSLCSWWDLRRLVSGEPDIDVDNLKRNSKYECVVWGGVGVVCLVLLCYVTVCRAARVLECFPLYLNPPKTALPQLQQVLHG